MAIDGIDERLASRAGIRRGLACHRPRRPHPNPGASHG